MLVRGGEGGRRRKLMSVAVRSGGNGAESLTGRLPTNLSWDASAVLHFIGSPGQTLMLHHKLRTGTTLTIR